MSSLTAHTTKDVDTQSRDKFVHELLYLQPHNHSKSMASLLADAVGKPLKSKSYTNSGVSQMSFQFPSQLLNNSET